MLRRAAFLVMTLLCAACGHIPQRSRWIHVAQPLENLRPEWDKTDESIVDGLRIKVMNSSQDLHLYLSTDVRSLQGELSGEAGHSVVFWFGEAPEGHGLSIRFTPKSSTTLLDEPIDMVDKTVTLLGPSGEGFPHAWVEGSEGVDCVAHMNSGTLFYELRLPFQPQGQGPGLFSLGLKAGDKLHFILQISSAQESYYRLDLPLETAPPPP